MKQHTIVCISGKQGSGKTTLAKALCKHYSGSHLKFATPLYEMHDAIKEILEVKYSYQMKEKDGKLLQLLGTEWGRNTLGQNIWADLTRSAIESAVNTLERFNDKAFIVVDDARFENELEIFMKFKSHFPEWRVLTVRLEAEELARKGRADSWREDAYHPSEIGLDHRVNDFDLILNTVEHTAESSFLKVCSEIEKSPQ